MYFEAGNVYYMDEDPNSIILCTYVEGRRVFLALGDGTFIVDNKVYTNIIRLGYL